MKKRTIISIAAATMISCPAFATGSGIGASAQSADCDNGVLGTYTGPASLSANWTANTINLDFYDGEDKISSGQCTYDAGITLPNDPTKTGYEFSGWKVRRAPAAPQCDFSVLSYPGTVSAFGYTYLDDGSGYTNHAKYGLTPGSGEWAVEYYHGIVKGQGLCSLVGSGMSEGQIGNPTDDFDSGEATYCWCKMTSYTPKPWIYDTGDASSNPIYLTGYTNKTNCITAIQPITKLNYSSALTLLNNASNENPQLITNATGADVAYLTDMGCTVSGATGHFGELGNTCPVVSSSWVFLEGNDEPYECVGCASRCANELKTSNIFRVAVYGVNQ